MINIEKFFKSLNDENIDFLTGVPDSLLNDFCLYAERTLSKDRHIIAANEGNAIAIAAGYQIATGKTPLVYMQNSGIGNAYNPLVSLTNKDVYSVPMVLLIGWRGDPSINDHEHHKLQGKITLNTLDLIDIPYRILNNDDNSVRNTIEWAKFESNRIKSPVAIVVKKDVLASGKKSNTLYINDELELTRGEAITKIIEFLGEDSIYVASTGRATRELYWIKNKTYNSHCRDFLNVGAMGHTSSIALGLAIGTEKHNIVCFDGDGSTIMHLGSLPIIGDIKPNNLLHIVLNNGSHESVGGQNSIGMKIDLTQIAESSGYNTIHKPVKTVPKLMNALDILSKSEGPGFIDIWIKKGSIKPIPPLHIVLNDIIDDFKEEIRKK